MITLSKTKDKTNNYDKTNIIFEVDDNGMSLPDLIQEMNNFIKAIGYSFDGVIDIVDDSLSNISEEDPQYFYVVYIDDGDILTKELSSEKLTNEFVDLIEVTKNATVIGAFVGEKLA